MKFRFRKSSLPHPEKRNTRRFFLCGRDTLRQKDSNLSDTPIEFSALFEFASLPDGDPDAERKKRSFRSGLGKRLKLAGKRAKDFLFGFFSALSAGIRRKLEERRQKKKAKKHESLYLYSGALCAAVLVALLSAAAVLAGLFLRYGAPYDTVTVPDLTGRPLATEPDEPFSYIIHYEYNPDVSPGVVISQSPKAGVTRKIYRHDRHCTLTLTVSREAERYQLPELGGMSLRDAELELRRHGLTVRIAEEYSDTVDAGHILLQEPVAGAVFSGSGEVTLTVSLGTLTLTAAVPNLLELTEMQAVSLLEAAGLVPGEITYRNSTLPAGSVIAQATPAGTQIPLGSSVSFTVSAGEVTAERTVPSLYGLSLAEATEALRGVGLLVGNVILVPSAAPSGTVISQTPPAGVRITSSLLTVDLYVSA